LPELRPADVGDGHHLLALRLHAAQATKAPGEGRAIGKSYILGRSRAV
jgi:hypothetical protein